MKPKFKEYGEKGNLVKLSFSIYAWFKFLYLCLVQITLPDSSNTHSKDTNISIYHLPKGNTKVSFTSSLTHKFAV
jgi:hypothetical protein